MNSLWLWLSDVLFKIAVLLGVYIHGKETARRKRAEEINREVKEAKDAVEEYHKDPSRIHDKYDRDRHGS